MNENIYNTYKHQGREDVDLKNVCSKGQLQIQIAGSQEELEIAYRAYRDGVNEREAELWNMGQAVDSLEEKKEINYYETGYQEGLRADIEAPKENDDQLSEKSGLEPETADFCDWVWGYHSALNHLECVRNENEASDRQYEWQNKIDEQREEEGIDEPCKDYSLYY